MDETRVGGLVAVVAGGLICAWQIYEVNNTNHFTLWVIGCIPLPVIVLGILLVLGGLLALVVGGKK